MKWLGYDEVATTEQPLNLPNNWISPFGACRVIINEINSQTPERNTNQFVELKKVCGPRGRHRSFTVAIGSCKDCNVVINEINSDNLQHHCTTCAQTAMDILF